jgi:hypothetical protein
LGKTAMPVKEFNYFDTYLKTAQAIFFLQKKIKIIVQAAGWCYTHYQIFGGFMGV